MGSNGDLDLAAIGEHFKRRERSYVSGVVLDLQHPGIRIPELVSVPAGEELSPEAQPDPLGEREGGGVPWASGELEEGLWCDFATAGRSLHFRYLGDWTSGVSLRRQRSRVNVHEYLP
ncbi:MAG: hypothetical protein ACRDVL_02975, partial [Acidimicrobiia bacterium]